MWSKRSITVSSLTAAFALLLIACGSSPATNPAAGPADGSSASGEGTLGTGTPPTSAPATAAPAAPSFPTTAEEYTKAAVVAWVAHDSSTLDAYETGGGILHGLSTSAYNTQFALAPNFCQGAAGSSYCLYFNTYGDELLLRVSNPLLGQAHAIVSGGSFTPTTFPSDEQAYAKETLDAWNSGNDNRLKLLTRQQLTSAAIDALGAQRGSDWTFDHSEGAMGSLYFQFTRGGHTIAFQFDNTDPDPAPSTGAAAQHRVVQVVYLG